MAILKLNNVNAITEASGAITIPALGTVTSGDLSNANIVFPAGHVDYFGHTIIPVASGVHTSTDFTTHGGVAVTVPAVTCNAMSHLTIIFNLSYYVGNGSSHTVIEVRGDRSAPSSATYSSTFIGADDNNAHTHRGQATYIIYDDSLSNADHTYRMQSRKGWGGGSSAGSLSINGYGVNILVLGNK